MQQQRGCESQAGILFRHHVLFTYSHQCHWRGKDPWMTADGHVTWLFTNHRPMTAECVSTDFSGFPSMCVCVCEEDLSLPTYSTARQSFSHFRSNDRAVIKSVHCLSCASHRYAAWRLSLSVLYSGSTSHWGESQLPIRPFKSNVAEQLCAVMKL